MAKRKTMVPFQGTKEQEARLMEVVNKYRTTNGALMPVLQEAQEIYGYLPEEVQIIVSKELGISFSEVYGVVTFYTQFSLNPKGEKNISVCMGTACYVKGAAAVLDRVRRNLGIEVDGITADRRFSLQATRCIGACGLAPVLTVNDDVYGRLVPDDVDKIINSYKE